MRRGWRPTLLGAAAGLLFAAGCAGTPGSSGPDPLMGGPPLPRGGARPAPPSAPLVGAVPPLPPPTSATSAAALAAGGPGRPVDPTRELRLNDTAPPAAHGATLGGVQAADGSARIPPPAPPAPPALTLTGGIQPTGEPSFEQLQARLAARGVTWQRLESLGDGEWRFSCAVPRPENPNIRTHYEARAAGGAAAVRAVLDAIDRSRGLGGR